MTSLKHMAEGVRAQERAAHAAAPANRTRARIRAGLKRKEAKRRAWRHAGPLFAKALGRTFSPERATYQFIKDSRDCISYTVVNINFEGKLDVWVEIYPTSGAPNYMYVRPVNARDERPATIYASHDMPRQIARHVIKWGLA